MGNISALNLRIVAETIADLREIEDELGSLTYAMYVVENERLRKILDRMESRVRKGLLDIDHAVFGSHGGHVPYLGGE